MSRPRPEVAGEAAPSDSARPQGKRRSWSAAPPGKDRIPPRVQIAGKAVPTTAGALRSEHFRRIVGSRGFLWPVAIGCAGSFLVFAARGLTLYAALAPVAVIAIALVVVDWSARSRAAQDFFKAFARTHELNYYGDSDLLETTPLLGAGDLRRYEHYMEGPLTPDMPDATVGVAHYTYEVATKRTDRRGRSVETRRPYRFTICVVELERAIRAFPGVYLSRRRGLLGRIGGDTWLDYDAMRSLELESASLAKEYELHIRRNQSDGLVLELFQPSFQVWLHHLPIDLCFEYSGGTLVTYVHGRVGDPTTLDIMLAATAKIAVRILEEGEPLKAGDEHPNVAPPPRSPSLRNPPPAPPTQPTSPAG